MRTFAKYFFKYFYHVHRRSKKIKMYYVFKDFFLNIDIINRRNKNKKEITDYMRYKYLVMFQKYSSCFLSHKFS